jgi:hypothetical protein
MILNIHGKIPSDDWLTIKVNGETKTLSRNDEAIPVVSFHINEKKQYEIEVDQELAASNRTSFWILFHVITIAIQGLCNIFLMNTDADWFNNVKAYRLKAKLLVDVQRDTDLRLVFTNSKYDKATNKWSAPSFTVEPDVVSSVDFIANSIDFGNQYFNYAKKLVSALILAILVLSLLLYFAVVHSITTAIIATSVVIIGLVVVVVLVCILQNKKLQKIYKSFLEHAQK